MAAGMSSSWNGGSSVVWWPRLEDVLSDRPALDTFREWLASNNNQQPLDLHFAVIAYTNMCKSRNAKTHDLAKEIYRKYISLRTGCCSFIPSNIRQEIGSRVKTGSAFDSTLFADIQPHVDKYLRRLHDAFVRSDEGVELFNQMNIECADVPSHRTKATSRHRNHMELTAETLLRTRRERDTTLGESSLERMYPSTCRAPYVCRATTSQNDSAVSSSFSSDAHRPIRLSSIREEHLRQNQHTFTIPPNEPIQHDSKQFHHETEDGRKKFAEYLTKKLLRLEASRTRNDTTEKQLRDIQEQRFTARDVVTTAFACPDAQDEEDDVEEYLERMRHESKSHSAQRSPHIRRVHSPKAMFTPLSTSGMGASPFFAVPPPPNLAPPTLPHILPQATPTYAINSFAPPPKGNNNNTQFAVSPAGFYAKESGPIPGGSSAYNSSGIESMAPSCMTDGSRGEQRRRRNKTHILTISYKGMDGVPVVAHVPTMDGGITFREFRKHFSIPSNSHMQFYFKTECDDGSAPYQLLLVNEDPTLLPLFNGKVTAEVKQFNHD